jgi:crossover junction endodeoxyribonuclease RusA
MSAAVTIEARGVPEPKGSMRAFVRNGRAIVTSDNPRLKQWQQRVRADAGAVCRDVLGVAVAVELRFRLPRPKALPKTRATPHTTRPDIDKLTRAVLDALTGVAWGDDSQVASLHATKRYAALHEVPGVSIFLAAAADVPIAPAPPSAHAQIVPGATSWSPHALLLRPGAASTAPPAPPAAPRMPRRVIGAAEPIAATSASALERQEL